MLHAQGDLLSIDVGERTAETIDISETLASYIGGRAACTRLAHERIPFDADPFGPENRLYLAAGPLQQSRMSFTGRMNMTALSPLTNWLLSTNSGAYLPLHFVDPVHAVVQLTGHSDELLSAHVTAEAV
jgi:aldehyde:ferredoxin oxidoreductase